MVDYIPLKGKNEFVCRCVSVSGKVIETLGRTQDHVSFCFVFCVYDDTV